MEGLEKEMDGEMKLNISNLQKEDNDKFLKNPQIAKIMTNYYYDLPNIENINLS
jgi:hypothetical protein